MGLAARIVGAVAIVTTLAGCAPARNGAAGTRPAPASNDAALYVFVADGASRGVAVPPPREASARREDGALVPLQVAPAPGPSPSPQRLWLSGALPAGAYAGVDLTWGATAGPVGVACPFVVASETATVLSAEVRGDRPGDVVLVRPPRIASGLLGLASVRGWDAVALFDKRTGKVDAVLPVGRDPGGLAVDVPRLRAYVTVGGDDAVAVLDLLEERVRERVTLRGGDVPLDAALTPDGRVLLVANSGSDTISFVDTVAAVETERLAVGARPVSVVVSPDGRRAYVVGERASAVTVVDVIARAVAGTIATDTGPVQARLGGRAGEVLYVAHGASPYLIAADTATLTATRRVYVGNGARAIEVDARAGRLFLARDRMRSIEVFDPSSLLPIDTIDLAADAVYLALETEGNGVGAVLPDVGEVAVVGAVGRKVILRAGLGPRLAALRFVEAR